MAKEQFTNLQEVRCLVDNEKYSPANLKAITKRTNDSQLLVAYPCVKQDGENKVDEQKLGAFKKAITLHSHGVIHGDWPKPYCAYHCHSKSSE